MSTTTPSSPARLPSPPPFPEIQIGPKSPSLGALSDSIDYTTEQRIIEANARRRIHPGTKAADMAAGPPLILLDNLESAFQLPEHLKALYYYHTKPEDVDKTIPMTRETATIIARPPEGVNSSLWLYQLCRFLINKCNDLIVGFLFDDPACSSTTCPEMRASEWQFLCAVHETPKSCCAIDYCCHTLDWATNIVTNQKIFPNSDLLEAGGELGEKREAGRKHLVNIFRRLHRIFAHAWFQHRGVFWQVESQTGLYVLFKTICDTHETLPAENFKLPPEAEGLEQIPEPKLLVPSILRAENQNPSSGSETVTPDMYQSLGRTNTKRHIRSSPSVGSAVTTVLETDEAEEDHNVNERLDDFFFGRESDLPVLAETETEAEQKMYEADVTSRSEAGLRPGTALVPGEATEAEADREPEVTHGSWQEPSREALSETENAISFLATQIAFETNSAEELEADRNEAAEAPAENGVENEVENGVENVETCNGDDLDEASELELEAFEEVPIPHLLKVATPPSQGKTESAQPVTLDADLKSAPGAGVDAVHEVTVEEVPDVDEEEKPDSETS